MKSRRHTVPIWKELNVYNWHILVWNKNLQNCRHSTKKYQYKKFLLRLYNGGIAGTLDSSLFKAIVRVFETKSILRSEQWLSKMNY